MKAITALPMGDVQAGLVYEKSRTHLWKDFSKTVRGAAEKIVATAILVLIAAVCIAAVLRVHDGCEATACFNEAIAARVFPGGTIN